MAPLSKSDFDANWPDLDRLLIDTSELPVHQGNRPLAVRCSTRLVRTGWSYWQTLTKLPEGYRISALDELSCFINESRDGMKDSLFHDELFHDLLVGSVTMWEWTHAALQAPRGSSSFNDYIERDVLGRVSYRANYIVGETVVAEGIRIPEGFGCSVVEWHEKLPLPALTSTTGNAWNLPRFYFNPSDHDVAVLLSRDTDATSEKFCLGLLALHHRSLVARHCAYRLFEGRLRDTKLRVDRKPVQASPLKCPRL